MNNNDNSRSWFCVFNNPREYGYTGTEQEICNEVINKWVDDYPERAGAVIYCISSNGLEHLHCVFEDEKTVRFTAIKKMYPQMHIEPTKGTKKQAEDYINKSGAFAESGEKILAKAVYGNIKGGQGMRSDMATLQTMILQGMSPTQIYNENFNFRRFDKLVRQAVYDYKKSIVPVHREIKVFWHVGESGSGKSYEAVKLCKKHGEENIFMMSDYETGGFDAYQGEKILFMDEFRGQVRYSSLLTILQGYKFPLHARYANIIPMWEEVHITSVLPPERVYRNMVMHDTDLDTMQQLYRRITQVIYHYKQQGEYMAVECPMLAYKGYQNLIDIVNMEVPHEWIV